MGSSARSGDSDIEKLLFNLPSDAAASEWSTPIETSVSPANYTETDACPHQETDEMQELMGALTRRGSFKVAKGLARISSSRVRRPGTRKGLGGAEQKKKLKNLRSIKLVSLDGISSRRKWSSNYVRPSSSPKEADVPPNYLKATRSSGVRMVSSQSSPHESKSSISSGDREGKIVDSFKPNTARNSPLIALRRTATLRPMRKLAKMPSLKPKRPATRKCLEISDVSEWSIHRATCSSAIKDSKFPAQVENQQGGDVSEKISTMKVCPYSYCSLHGHCRSAPTLKRLKSARKRVKSQRSKKLDGLVQNEVKDLGREISHEAEDEKESNEEIDPRTDMGLNADGGDRIEVVAEVALQEKKRQNETANPPVAGEENLHQASDSNSEFQHCLEPSPTSQDAHIKRESEQGILECINAKKKEREESEEIPDSGKGKFVSVGVQTDLKLEELGNEFSAADHIASDPHKEISEVSLTVQEIEDEKPPLSGNLSHEDSTSKNEQSNSSKTAVIGEEEEEQARAVGTEELASANGKMEENLESPGEPKEALADSREETILVREKREEKQESLGETSETSSSSSEELNLQCRNMDENLQSPGESKLDSTGNDSFKSSYGRHKFNGLWYLIYQHMVSDLAENGGLESPVDQDSTEQEVINANMLPELDRDPKVANDDKAAQQEGLQQSDAIKLLQEAISIILEQSQDQRSMRKSTANTVNFDKVATVEDHSTDSKSEKEPEVKEEVLEANIVPRIMERGASACGRSNQLASKRWSNLKKYILMKRFIKAMEKAKNFSQRIQRHPSSEVSPEQEKVSLRRQLIGERKNAEEWMLDHALQKVISNLEPAQKRRVALLVEAFERVNPIPGGKTRLSMNASSPSPVNPSGSRKTSSVQTEERAAAGNVSYDKLHIGQVPSPSDKCIEVKEKLCGPSEDGDGDLKEREKFVASPTEQPSRPMFASEQPGVANDSVLPQLAMDKINTENMDQAEGPGEGTVPDFQRTEIQSSNSQLESGNDGTNRKSLVDSDIPRIQLPEDYVELTEVEVSTSSSQVHNELNDPTAASNALDDDVKSMMTEELTGAVEEDDKAVVEKEEILGSSLPEQYRPISVMDVEDEPQLEKKKYTGLWYLIYKHMASGLATEHGSEPTDPLVDGSQKEEEEAENEEDEKKSRSIDIDSPDSLEFEQNMLMDQRADSQEMKLRKIEAVRLVQQAIDDILREREDSSAHDRYNTGNGVPEQESKEKSCSGYGETSLPASIDSIKDDYMRFRTAKEHKLLLDPEIQIGSDDTAQPKERTVLQGANKSNPRPVKNWNNLRKVILLKRFVKALETKVSNFNPREPRHLPLDPDMEPEKVNLKHQDMDERKSAEEYLLDYALQQVVSRLTPARKRKVHLLVEAFETITPPLRK